MAFIDDDERINAGFIRAYAEFFDAHPDAVVAGGRIIAEYVSGRPAWMSKYTERLSPTRWISAMPYGLFLPDVFPGEATWLSAAPQPSDTAGSTLRWGVWEGC